MISRTAIRVAVTALTVALAPGSAMARPGYRFDVPNGYTHGCITCHNNPRGGSGCERERAVDGGFETVPATPWVNFTDPPLTDGGVPVPQCPACTDPLEPNPGVAPCLNPFGDDYETLSLTLTPAEIWASLATMDSDGDGWTNGEELGDPSGTWVAITEGTGFGMRTTNDPAFYGHPGDTGGTVNLCCITQTADIDECAADYDTCSDTGTDTCDNVEARPGHSYACNCLTGWDGDDCDVCADGYTGTDCATCDTGYSSNGSGECIDDDECMAGTDDCAATASCQNLPGSFMCECLDGYADDGGGICVDVDECMDGTATCGANSECVNQTGAPYTCECEEGYAGDPCTETCGDGVRGPNEECDDGDTTAGDGCNAACREESGFVCTGDVGEMSDCTSTGTDAGAMLDGGVSADAGPESDDGGCACRAGHRSSRAPVWLLLGALGLVVGWRRRRVR